MIIEQYQIEQVNGYRIENFPGGQEPIGGGLEMTTKSIGIRIGQSGHGGLDLLPKLSRGQQVLMLHRLEQAFNYQKSEADSKKGGKS